MEHFISTVFTVFLPTACRNLFDKKKKHLLKKNQLPQVSSFYYLAVALNWKTTIIAKILSSVSLNPLTPRRTLVSPFIEISILF